MIRNPANIRIRIKLYPYLLKSRTASTIFPHAIQVSSAEWIPIHFLFSPRPGPVWKSLWQLDKCSCEIFLLAIRSEYHSEVGRMHFRIHEKNWDGCSFSSAESNSLSGVSKLLLHALEKVLNTETNKAHDASRLRSLAYVLIGKLSYRVPKLLADDIRLTQQFFEALKTEDNECCLNIQEALK